MQKGELTVSKLATSYPSELRESLPNLFVSIPLWQMQFFRLASGILVVISPLSS